MSDANINIVVTRSGRTSKKPVRYEPEETCLDDYSDDGEDYELDDSDVESIRSSDSEESDDDDDSDGDDNGNLKGFIVDDSDEDDEDCD